MIVFFGLLISTFNESIAAGEEKRLCVSSTFNETVLVMSAPAIAPHLYDVIFKTTGSDDLETVYVTVMAQEI